MQNESQKNYKILVMPDPLEWKGGFEFGLHALAKLKSEHCLFHCYLSDHGEFLEAIAYAVHNFLLKENITYMKNIKSIIEACDIILLPRVYPMEQDTIHDYLHKDKVVITSDPKIEFRHPRLISFHRRDWFELAEILLSLSKVGK